MTVDGLPPDDVNADSPLDDTAEPGDEQGEAPNLSFERVRQTVAQAREARPKKLILCINGRPCAWQPVDQVTQSITVRTDEQVEFIEVLTEEGIRLTNMDNLGLDAGPQHGRVVLSGDRTIELQVSGDRTGRVTVQVVYHDPSASLASES